MEVCGKMNIDIHNHFISEQYFKMVACDEEMLKAHLFSGESGEEMLLINGEEAGPVSDRFYHPDSRIRDMEAMGVDFQVVSPSPFMFYYWADGDVAMDVARLTNDGIASLVKARPGEFAGMATVPLQDVAKAADELRRAATSLGLKALYMGTNINGKELDCPELWPFYEEVQSLDIPIFLHPFYGASSERMKDYYFKNLIGNPLDTTLAASRLIFGGVLKEFARLCFCLPHGGGQLPYIIGRLRHGYNVRAECKTKIEQAPEAYLGNFYFDTITHYGSALAYLVRSMSPSRVLLGSDYPYDMGDWGPVSSVRKLSGFSEAEKSMILGMTAKKLLKLRTI